MNKKKVLIILLGNIKYDGRVLKTIKSLQSFGYNVELLTTELCLDDSVEEYNFKIHYIPRKSGGGIFVQSFRNLFFYYQTRKIIKKINPYYIHCNDLSSTIYAFGFFDRKVIYDSHELALEVIYGVRRILFTILERFVVEKSYRIILPQIDRLNIFYFKYKKIIKKEKLFLIENFPLYSPNYNRNFFVEEYSFNGNTSYSIVSYTGCISPERKIEDIIRAMINVEKTYLFIIGSGTSVYIDFLENLIVELDLSEIVFLKPPLCNSKMIDVAASSDIGICFYADSNLNSYFCASNKLYEYLNTGCKVLTNNIGGVRNVIEQLINGYMISSITPSEIAKAINLLQKSQQVGSKYNYYWENNESELQKVYNLID